MQLVPLLGFRDGEKNPGKKEGERRGKRVLLRAAWFLSPRRAQRRSRGGPGTALPRCRVAAPAPRRSPGSRPPPGPAAATDPPARSLRPEKLCGVKKKKNLKISPPGNTHPKLKRKGENPAPSQPKALQIQITRIVEKRTRNGAEAGAGAAPLPAAPPPSPRSTRAGPRPPRGPPGLPPAWPPRRLGPRRRSHPPPGPPRARGPRPRPLPAGASPGKSRVLTESRGRPGGAARGGINPAFIPARVLIFLPSTTTHLSR